MANITTPFIKRMRSQGGTIYTFSSAVEDIGLNINEKNNVVKISYFALLDLPNITRPDNIQQNRFNVLAIDGALQTYDESDSIKDGRVVVGESFQNYALNLEANLLNQTSYNQAVLKTVSERVFWKWLKETGAIRWTSYDTSISGTSYWVEETDTDVSVGYNSVVKYIGEISAGSVRTDTFGTYNETYVLVPTSHGQTNVYFKQQYDDNYLSGMELGPGDDNILGRESYTHPHPDGLSLFAQYDVIDSSITTGSWTMAYDISGNGYSNGWWYTGQEKTFTNDNYYVTDLSTVLVDPSTYNYKLKYTGASTIEFQRSNVDALNIEFDLDTLKTIYNDTTLTYDKMALTSQVDDTFDFNAVLIYYTVYNQTLDQALATNLLGILFLEPTSGSTSGFPIMEITIPALTKIASNATGFGSSYSFRLNIKSDNISDDTQATIYDESTSAQTALENWTDVFSNLEKSLNILNKHTNTINYITKQYMNISSIQTQQENNLTDIQSQVNSVTREISGTEFTIPIFSNGDDPLVDSSIYMRNGNVGIHTRNPLYTLDVSGNIKTKNITVEYAVKDTSDNLLIGYGTSYKNPLQIGASTNTRPIEFYPGYARSIVINDASIRIDSSIYFDGNILSSDISINELIAGDTSIMGILFVDGSLTTGDIHPKTHNTFDIGTSDNIWDNIWADNFNSKPIQSGTDAVGYRFFNYTGSLIQGQYSAYYVDGSLHYLYAGKTYNDYGLKIYPDGSTNLYHNNALKLNTTSTGVNITGNASIGGNVNVDSSIIMKGFNDTSTYWLSIDVTGALTANIVN